MAAIDKIYGTYKQWCLLHDFLNKEKPEYIRFLYQCPSKGAKNSPLSNFSREADEWLWENCPFDFVLNALKQQYCDKL